MLIQCFRRFFQNVLPLFSQCYTNVFRYSRKTLTLEKEEQLILYSPRPGRGGGRQEEVSTAGDMACPP